MDEFRKEKYVFHWWEKVFKNREEKYKTLQWKLSNVSFNRIFNPYKILRRLQFLWDYFFVVAKIKILESLTSQWNNYLEKKNYSSLFP